MADNITWETEPWFTETNTLQEDFGYKGQYVTMKDVNAGKLLPPVLAPPLITKFPISGEQARCDFLLIEIYNKGLLCTDYQAEYKDAPLEFEGPLNDVFDLSFGWCDDSQFEVRVFRGYKNTS